MELFGKNTDDDLCIIAEIGVNHGGSVEWIIQLLPQLKEAKVDAVKLQLFTPENYVVRTMTERFAFLKSRMLTRDDYLKILDVAYQIGIKLFATPLTEDWVPFLLEHSDTVKIASGDFLFYPTVLPLLESEAKLIFSTGGVSKQELAKFMQVAREKRPFATLEESISILHCVSAYPPPLSEFNMRAIPWLSKQTNLTIGFSNHFLSDSPIYCSVALGARIVEIHVTDDRSRTDVRDHLLSRTPEELKTIVRELKDLNLSLKQSEKEIQPSEIANIPLMRKGIISKTHIALGEVFSEKNIGFARPETDIGASDYERLIGSTAKKSISAHTSLTNSHIED